MEGEKTRQEHREKRQRKKRERVPQHGRSIVRVYKDAILKRLGIYQPKGPEDG